MEERAGLTREFAERLEKRLDELKWLYAELYHNDENAFRYFLSMIERMYEARPEELKALDREREQGAGWYRSARHDAVHELLRRKSSRRAGKTSLSQRGRCDLHSPHAPARKSQGALGRRLCGGGLPSGGA